MIRLAPKCISSLLILSWALLFLVIEPTHHHEDNKSHSDCPICMVAKQPGSIVSHISLPAFVYTLQSEMLYPDSRYSSTDPLQIKSRSPPEA